MCKVLRRLKKPVLLLFLYLIVPFLMLNAKILDILARPLVFEQRISAPADAVVVLGAGFNKRALILGRGSITRLRYGAVLYKKGLAKKIILTGGIVKKWYPSSEAAAMRRVLGWLGVPERDVLYENLSVNTYTGMVHASALIYKHGMNNALVVTSRMNSLRAVMTFKGRGYEVTSAPTPYDWFMDRGLFIKWKAWRGVVHEYLGLIWYYLKGYIIWP